MKKHGVPCQFGTVAIVLQTSEIPELSLTLREALWTFTMLFAIICGKQWEGVKVWVLPMY